MGLINNKNFSFGMYLAILLVTLLIFFNVISMFDELKIKKNISGKIIFDEPKINVFNKGDLVNLIYNIFKATLLISIIALIFIIILRRFSKTELFVSYEPKEISIVRNFIKRN